MGHSAGAHLVALLASSPTITAKAGASAWLATIALDSAAYDINKIMEQKHYRFYDDAFGTDPAYWQASSPTLQLKQAAAPFLAVCSSNRPDQPCAQAGVFVDKAKSLGMQATLLPQSLSHADINKNLGLDNAYTAAVDNFLKPLASAIQ
jgi:acetyl esterase/lipase